MISTCARCGAPKPDHADLWVACGDGAWSKATEPAIIACRDRQIAAQASLLRSVTGKLEEAATMLADIDAATCGEVSEPLDIINGVLETLS